MRICWGPIGACYVRVGGAGTLVRAGTICRHCGHMTPEGGPPLYGCPEATPEEVAQWRREHGL